MNKARIEALSDGVFAIVMTLLIIELRVPAGHDHHVGAADLWFRLFGLWPLIQSYIISFLVLAMYWTAHHAFFHFYVKEVDRLLSLLNILFLMFVSCIPFSAHLLGEYSTNVTAIFIYGCNVILLGVTLYFMLRLVIREKRLQHEALSKRLIVQGNVRILLPPFFALLAILVAPYYISLSYILFAFPIVFNIVPGTLDSIEKTVSQWLRSLKR